MNPNDPENMIDYLDALPDDLEKAWLLGNAYELPQFAPIRKVCIAGMGGSAIGGDFLAAFLAKGGKVPLVSWRNYDLPKWAEGEDCLVVCSSHSGNTEETLSAFAQALKQGCSVMAFCTGGELEKRARAAGKACWVFEHHGQPRTAIPFAFGILLALLKRLGLADFDESEIAEAAEVMRDQRKRIGTQSALHQNPAMRMAGQLMNRNVVVLAAGENEVIARRWKGQIAELAKGWASFEGLPEMNHNTLAGLQFPENLFEKSSAIFLRAEMDHARNKIRIEHSMQQFMVAGMAVDAVHASGKGRLAQMWSLLQFGDYVAYYLALNYGVDPTPIEALNALKKKLASAPLLRH
ncbi:MAG: bifunctional phosphoglucose/phosphomannose isomerase [Anaerolineaceae bacterium]|nr:bifunctional phosphoglucose/phosphomannose isomerase [Anaerolineaceae bacterium]